MYKFHFAPAVVMALVSISAPAFADSSVNFANGSSVGLPLVLGSGSFGFDSAGIHSGNYVAQLFESTDGGASFSAVGTTSAFFNVATTSVRAGVWKSQAITLVGVNPGNTVSLKVAVWDSTLFANWDSAVAETQSFTPIPGKLGFGDRFQLGITPSFSYNTPPLGDLNPADFNMLAFPGLSLSSYVAGFNGTPEPTTTALTVVGSAGLAFYCRQKFKSRTELRKVAPVA